MEFRWNEWNLHHISKHGVEPEEVEDLIERARPPYPEKIEEDKWIVLGQTVLDATSRPSSSKTMATRTPSLSCIAAR